MNTEHYFLRDCAVETGTISLLAIKNIITVINHFEIL
jgi:hypothetical protein